jgi:hypothetical protein
MNQNLFENESLGLVVLLFDKLAHTDILIDFL